MASTLSIVHDRPDVTKDAALQRALRKNLIRLVPLLAIGYFFNYIDRTNIGFAALTMNRDIGLTVSQFGMAAGLFRRARAIHVDAGTHQARRGGKSEAMSVPRAPLRIMTPTTSSTPPSPYKPASP